jgi:hypothetical protein
MSDIAVDGQCRHVCDTGRIRASLMHLVGPAAALLYVVGQVEVAPRLHLVLHAMGLSHGGPLPAHLR